MMREQLGKWQNESKILLLLVKLNEPEISALKPRNTSGTFWSIPMKVMTLEMVNMRKTGFFNTLIIFRKVSRNSDPLAECG